MTGSDFEDDENTLPCRIDTSKLSHFEEVQISVIFYRKRVDLLILQSDKFLLTILEKRKGFDSNEPNCVRTRLRPMASGGRMDISSNLINTGQAVVNECQCNDRRRENLRPEKAGLKENLRNFKHMEKELLPIREDNMVRSLVEPNIKVVNGRFEMPVSINYKLDPKFPLNYKFALKRPLSLRASALTNAHRHVF